MMLNEDEEAKMLKARIRDLERALKETNDLLIDAGTTQRAKWHRYQDNQVLLRRTRSRL